MARDGSGNYALPSGNPVVTGTTISSTTHNTTMSDIASALTQSLSKDGQTAPSADLQMAGFKLTSVGNASARNQYASAGQIQDGGLVTLGSVSGTDTIAASSSPAITAYASGQQFRFIAGATNTGAATININALGAKAITKNGSTALVAGDIQSGAIVTITYDGTRFQLGNVQVDALAVHLAGTEAITGDKTFSGATAFTGSVEEVSTDAGASAGPTLSLYRNSASPAASDVVGQVVFYGKDSAANKESYADIVGAIVDPTSTSEDGAMQFRTIIAGTFAARWVVGAGLYYSGGTDTGAGTFNASGYYLGGANIRPALAADQESPTDPNIWVTPAIQHRHPSAVKAWCKCDFAGNISGTAYGVSSVTDGGTGNVVFNYSVAFSSVNYAPVGTVLSSGQTFCNISAMGTTSTTFQCYTSNTAAAVDGTNLSMLACGDQ